MTRIESETVLHTEAPGVPEAPLEAPLLGAVSLGVARPWEVDNRFVEERRWNEKQLRELHQEILRLLVLGWQPSAIAQELGIHTQTVSNVRNSPLARERLASLGGLRDERIVEITERVREFAPVALAVLEEIIKGEREAPIALVARTAENYLSRAGHGTIQKNIVAHGHLSRSDIEDIKERARSAARQCGVMVSEADYASQHAERVSPLAEHGGEEAMNGGLDAKHLV